MTVTETQTPYLKRQARLAQALAAAGMDGVAINPGPTLYYLTGLNFHLMERPTVGLFTPHGAPVLVLPELETGKLAGLDYPLRAFAYGEDPATWGQVFVQALQAAELVQGTVGVEPGRMRVLELRYLEGAANSAKFVAAEELLAGLRLRKDATEVEAMRKAVDIAQRGLQATLPLVKLGITERELASELVLQLLRAGADGEFPFLPIVSFGPNSANPHAVPSTRRLASGDLLLIDWGAAYEGYVSDLTRTFAIGAVEPELKRIYELVKNANAAGRAVARPGIPAEAVDAATRAVIEQGGYGERFIHRTGHGIGMEGHEAPYMRAGNTQILEPGMAFTVEPGIYLTGRGGVRIEDDVVITRDGAETLSDLPRELETLL